MATKRTQTRKKDADADVNAASEAISVPDPTPASATEAPVRGIHYDLGPPGDRRAADEFRRSKIRVLE